MAEVVKKYPNIELWIVGDGAEKSNLKSKNSPAAPEHSYGGLGKTEIGK